MVEHIPFIDGVDEIARDCAVLFVGNTGSFYQASEQDSVSGNERVAALLNQACKFLNDVKSEISKIPGVSRSAYRHISWFTELQRVSEFADIAKDLESELSFLLPGKNN